MIPVLIEVPSAVQPNTSWYLNPMNITKVVDDLAGGCTIWFNGIDYSGRHDNKKLDGEEHKQFGTCALSAKELHELVNKEYALVKTLEK